MAPARTPQHSIPIPIPGIPGAPPIHVHVPGTGPDNGVHIPSPSGIVQGVRSWGEFLGALTNPNTWIRVAEVGVGVILIAVGVAAMLKIDVKGDVGKVAGVAKLAAL